MEIIPLITKENRTGKENKTKLWNQFLELIEILRSKNLPEEFIAFINSQIQELNEFPCGNVAYYKIVKQKQSLILQKLEKELKMVPKNYYMNLWLALGIGAFGMPIGVVIGSISGNMGLLSIGLPFGVAIGIALGSYLDKKAKESGNQLEIEMKY